MVTDRSSSSLSSPWSRLLRWYRAAGRQLPWRATTDPYRILVSEVMLQQTQVERVKRYYARWLTAFPTFKALAQAPRRKLLAYWSGLGYNRRALYLQRAAQGVVDRGRPTSAVEWSALPGIGRYTAAAVSLFSRNEAVLPVDTNIRRVLGRLLLGVSFPVAAIDDRIVAAAQGLLRSVHRRDLVQGLFDLGATICQKRPQCANCPLVRSCRSAPGFLAGTVTIPAKSVPRARERRHRDKPFPDRIYRGRALRALQTRSYRSLATLAREVDPSFRPKWDSGWFAAMLGRLAHDGLISQRQYSSLVRPRPSSQS